MAPSEDRGNDSSHNDDETNIFVAFRHLADDHIAALINSMKDFTSFGQQARERWNDANEKSKDRFEHCRQKILEHRQHAEQKWAREEDWLRKSWEKVAASADEALKERESRRDEEAKALARSDSRGTPEAPSQPSSQTTHKSDPNSEVVDVLDLLRPFGFGFGLHQNSKLPLSYVLRSPYSPLHLQDNPPTSKAPVDWKVAFEDLLETSQGYGTQERQSQPQTTKSQITNEDWAARLVNKGLVGYDFFSATAGLPHDAWSWPFDHEHGSGDEGEAETELDLYERFLGHDGATGKGNKVEESAIRYTQLGASAQEQTSEKPNILSTFTKTESKTLLDGSVVTKTVLKKRFSDGSEENNETTNTTPPRARNHETQEIDEGSKRRELMQKRLDDMKRRDQEKKSSWFWS